MSKEKQQPIHKVELKGENLTRTLGTLNEEQRVAAAMIAAGKAPRFAQFLPDKYKKQIAALCNANGVAVPDVQAKVITILRECGKDNKAEVDGLTEE